MKRAATALAAFCICVLVCAPSRAQSVVVNKYQNSGTTADIVELLVIQDSLDMRGMILKDFSSNMANDGGGKYQFTTNTLWSSVPAGTLIVLRNNNSAADTTAGGGDFNLDIGLQNTTYFTNAGGTFDIATTEMVMIKAAGSGAAGVTGNIHTLAGGTAGAQFTATATPKLRASGTSAAGQFVFANNSTQTLADFNGTDATGAATGLTFGAGNNANNTAYINSLCGGARDAKRVDVGCVVGVVARAEGEAGGRARSVRAVEVCESLRAVVGEDELPRGGRSRRAQLRRRRRGELRARRAARERVYVSGNARRTAPGG